MVEVRYDREALSIEARGHARAERNQYGHDLVCAAVSTLMQAWAYAGLRTGHVMEVDKESGVFFARLDPDATPSPELRSIFDGYVLGLKLCAENYPEHVRVINASEMAG